MTFRVIAAALSVLTISACGGAGKPSIKKNASRGDIAVACQYAVVDQAAKIEEGVDLMVEMGERRGGSKNDAKTLRRAMSDYASRFEKKGASECCSVVKKASNGWNKDQRNFAYARFVLSNFSGLTPNESSRLQSIRDTARGDLNMEQVAGPAALNLNYSQCMRKVEGEVEQAINKKYKGKLP